MLSDYKEVLSNLKKADMADCELDPTLWTGKSSECNLIANVMIISALNTSSIIES